MRARARVNPIQVQKFLTGVDYPVSKADLVRHAREQPGRATRRRRECWSRPSTPRWPAGRGLARAFAADAREESAGGDA